MLDVVFSRLDPQFLWGCCELLLHPPAHMHAYQLPSAAANAHERNLRLYRCVPCILLIERPQVCDGGAVALQ